MFMTTPLATYSNSEDSQTGTAKGKSKRRRGTIIVEDGLGKRKRAQNACTTCRQQKLRCDGPAKFPAPCSRCADHGLPCRVDPTFKRTPARQQLAQVSRQLENMRERLELRSTQPAEEAPGLEIEPKSEAYTPNAPVFPVLELSLLPEKIGDIVLETDTIVVLFQEFHSNYHPHLPIVNTTDPVETIFTESPLLFYAILFIASRHHLTSPDLSKQLILQLEVMTSEFSANPGKYVIDKGIQALLLLCSWPTPFGKQIDDTSWLRCGTSTHLALLNGFHRPGSAQEFREGSLTKDDIRGRTAIWLACFLIDFSYAYRNGLGFSEIQPAPFLLPSKELCLLRLGSLSSKLGLPATVTPDFTIRNPPPDLPKKFKQHLQIAYACSKFTPNLSGNQFSATGLIDASSRWSLIQLFDGELEALHTQLSQATPSCPLPAESDIVLLTSWLHLQAYVLQEDIQNVVGPLETSGMMIKGFRTAIKLIDVISSEHKKDVLKFYPTYINRSLVMGALLLLKLIAISDSRKSAQASKNLIDPQYATTVTALLDNKSVEIAENYVREVFIILLKLSISPSDESQRAARFIEAMGSRRDGELGPVGWGNPTKMRSRMGSSIFYDAVRQLRERSRLTAFGNTPEEHSSVIPDRSQQKGLHNGSVSSTTEPKDTGDGTEVDTMPIDQSLWGALGELDGLAMWDSSWDNGFGFFTPLDN